MATCTNDLPAASHALELRQLTGERAAFGGYSRVVMPSRFAPTRIAMLPSG